MVIIDGLDGQALVEPTDEELEDYKARAKLLLIKKQMEIIEDAKSVTADGKEVKLAANIGTPKDVEGANDNGAKQSAYSVLNFFTWMLLNCHLKKINLRHTAAVEGMNGKQVVVRTMDIGGDKELPYLPLPEEQNPFLGYRAIRISLDLRYFPHN